MMGMMVASSRRCTSMDIVIYVFSTCNNHRYWPTFRGCS